MKPREAGSTLIHEEQASGADYARPALARLLARIRAGDSLVARSLVHLLRVTDLLEGRGAHFLSLGDPVDTGTPQGKSSLQVTARWRSGSVR